MDVGGRPDGALLSRDSNPGRVSFRPGGVGRNIAHDLRLLGLEVSLVTALGGDANSAALLQSCRELGLDMDMSFSFPGESGCVYLYMTDETGDMRLGLSDMALMARLTPALLEPLLPRLNGYDALVLDANLPTETLSFLAERCAVPLYADPVSAAKAPRLEGILPRLAALKPNALEAEALTGESEPEKAAAALLERGVGRVFVSLGAEGLLAAEKGALLRLPAERVPLVNANGAGDAATAAIVWAGTHALSLEAAARAAALAGAAAAASPETNPASIRAAWWAMEEE